MKRSLGEILKQLQTQSEMLLVILRQTKANLCIDERMEMFYLTMHSTHYIYSYVGSENLCIVERKEMFDLMMHSTHLQLCGVGKLE